MTTRRLVLEAGVEEEIAQATDWHEEQRPDLGLELEGEVRRVFGDLVRVPDKSVVATGVAKELGIRRVLLRTFPYAVVFMVVANTVHVLAFAHLKKKPNYWRSRLRHLVEVAPAPKKA